MLCQPSPDACRPDASRFYAAGQSYAHLAGCDASRAFVTGPDDGKGLTDDLSGMGDDELASVAGWHEFFSQHENYTRVGRVSGRYFDAEGHALERFPWARLKAGEQREEQLKRDYPGCNSRWTKATGSEVWCTAKSGGISRDWAGVPRLMTTVKVQKERCACVQVERSELQLEQPDPLQPLLRPYPGCELHAERCKVIKGK